MQTSNLSEQRIMWIKGFGYESEHTKFIRELKEKKPYLDEEQRKGRAILWDKAPLDLEQRARDDAAKVSQKAYPYQTE